MKHDGAALPTLPPRETTTCFHQTKTEKRSKEETKSSVDFCLRTADMKEKWKDGKMDIGTVGEREEEENAPSFLLL